MAMLPMTSMVVSALFLSVAVLVTQAAGGGAKAKVEDLVVGACKNLTNDLLSDKVHFDEKACISLLHTDNRSMTANDHGDLVVIALDLLEHCTQETVANIDTILREPKVHNLTRRAFQLCSTYYASMVRTIPVCREIFLNLKPLGKKAPCSSPDGDDSLEALTCMDNIGEAAKRCYDDSDLLHEFRDVLSIVSLAWGLIELATECRDIYSDKW